MDDRILMRYANELLKLNSYGGVVRVMPFAASLTPVSAHFLRQESIPSDYLRQATCITLGVMLKFDATQHFAAKRRTQQALYEVTYRWH